MIQRKIPPALIGTASPILADEYTHATLDSLFMSAGFPGDPPTGNKIKKCQEWLRRANKECDNSLEMFGNLIAEYFDSDSSCTLAKIRETSIDPRDTIREAFAREGLSYSRGGYIHGASLSVPSKALADRIRSEGVRALEVEYKRAYDQLEADPPAALTAACAILETVCKTYLETEGYQLPNKQVLGSLWADTSSHLGLSPKDLADQDMKRILSGLSSIADGIAALRTHQGSAHGHSDGPIGSDAKKYRLMPRHARLAVHAGSCPIAWCKCGVMITAISGVAGSVSWLRWAS